MAVAAQNPHPNVLAMIPIGALLMLAIPTPVSGALGKRRPALATAEATAEIDNA